MSLSVPPAEYAFDKGEKEHCGEEHSDPDEYHHDPGLKSGHRR
jgi:hypothetical protein